LRLDLGFHESRVIFCQELRSLIRSSFDHFFWLLTVCRLFCAQYLRHNQFVALDCCGFWNRVTQVDSCPFFYSLKINDL
jgi:hypothetical protein